MAYKTMDPDLIREILANEEDVITPAVENEKALYENIRCPVCGGVGAEKVTLAPLIEADDDGNVSVIRSPFQKDRILSVGHARCKECGSEYVPETQVIYKTSEPVITDVEESDLRRVLQNKH